jgi:hypothetical protein
MPQAPSIAHIVKRFTGCPGEEATAAIRAIISKTVEMIELASESPTRVQAKDFFGRVADHAGAIDRALRNPLYGMILRRDTRDFCKIEAASLSALLQGLAGIASRRAELVKAGGGRFRFYAELGFPTPEQLIACFVVLLWERTFGKKPDSETGSALEACYEIWEVAQASCRDQPGAADLGSIDRWERHLSDAREGIQDWEQWDARQFTEVAAGPHPPAEIQARAGITYSNAVFICNTILDQAGQGTE